MADVVYLLIVLAFFALCLLYIRGCERMLRGADDVVEVPHETAR